MPGPVDPAVKFRQDVEKWNRKLDANTRKSVIGYAQRLIRSISRATPFDTGRAASSWTANVQGADTRVQPPEIALASHQQALGFLRISLGNFILGDSIHIANSLPYIWRLNAGHSGQAPANFVEAVVAKVPGPKSVGTGRGTGAITGGSVAGVGS